MWLPLQDIHIHETRKREYKLTVVRCSNEVEDSDMPKLQMRDEVWRHNISPDRSERYNQLRSDNMLSKGRLVLDRMMMYCANRALISSIEGYLGLAPAEVMPGDIITALLGCDSVMILRPVDDGRYQVIGEGLCRGFLNGEGFLGALPTPIEQLLYSTARGEYCVFRNRDTKEFLFGDPRLDKVPLPEDRKKEEYDDERKFFSIFVNEKTGERWSVDPRMTPEVLRTRGVDLKVFELV